MTKLDLALEDIYSTLVDGWLFLPLHVSPNELQHWCVIGLQADLMAHRLYVPTHSNRVLTEPQQNTKQKALRVPRILERTVKDSVLFVVVGHVVWNEP